MSKNKNQDDEKFRLFYERSPLGYQSLDEEGCFLEVNPAWLELLGYSHDEVIGKCFGDFITLEDQKLFTEKFPVFKAAGEIRGVFFNMVHKDGHVVSVEIDGKIGYDKEGHFQQTHCVLHDITARKQAEAELLNSENQLQIRNRILEIFLSFPDEQMYAEMLNVILDTLESDFGTFGYFNEEGTFFCPSMTRKIYWDKCNVADKEIIFEKGTFGGIWGRAIKERKTFYDNKGPFNMPKGHIPIKNTMATPIIYKGEIISAIHVANKSTDYKKHDVGLIETIADNIAPVLFARLDRDRKEKERKKMEKALHEAYDELEERVKERTAELMSAQNQIIRSERLAATGQLAASVTHEINSPLQAITVLLGTIKRKHGEDKELLDNIDLLKGAFNNIRDTVKSLMDLNRPGKERKQMINVNVITESTVALMKSHLKKNNVKIKLNLSSKVPDIIVSPQQLGHVFLNLINNAVEAMSGVSKSEAKWKERAKIGGDISIKTTLKKDKVVIQVSDTGPGIAEEDLEHIFDPFYTKKKTMGMGIGLSICNGIIEDHNGTIEVKNAKEGGAVFTITLPLK